MDFPLRFLKGLLERKTLHEDEKRLPLLILQWNDSSLLESLLHQPKMIKI